MSLRTLKPSLDYITAINVMQLLCQWWFKLKGWKVTDKPVPDVNKAVLIFAPHTSNWDFPTMLAAKFALGIQVTYLGKHSLFKWPYGWFFRAIGGIPVYRHENRNLVDQVVDLIAEREHIFLALSPEGTRSYTNYWRSGFYRIAERANIPIIMFYLDANTKEIGFSEPFYPTGDLNADMLSFKAFYEDKVGFRPQLASAIQSKSQYANRKKSH
jgi:1-acyl-sn-glycerol-3-phosphate acyltransferase